MNWIYHKSYLKEKTSLLHQIVKDVFPQNELVSIDGYKQGCVNDIFSVHLTSLPHPVVIRCCDNTIQKNTNSSTFSKEQYIYSLVGDRTDVPIPTIYGVGTIVLDDPVDYIVMQQLEGVTLDDLTNVISIENIYRLVGQTLAQVHSISFSEYGSFGEHGIDNPFTTWKCYFIAELEKLVRQGEEIKSHLPDKFMTKCEKFCRDQINALNLSPIPCLVHNDWHGGNIIINPESRNSEISGIIDWQLSLSGDKDLDLVYAEIFLFTHQPNNIYNISSLRQSFIDGYNSEGIISNSYDEKENLYFVYLALAQIIFNYQIKDFNEVDYFINSVRKIIE